MKQHLPQLFIAIATILATSLMTVFLQRSFLSKAEENNFVRELIPALLSSAPRQTDVALMLVKESVSESKYDGLKQIIDRKVEHAADISAPNLPQPKKVDPQDLPKDTYETRKQRIETAQEYAKLRPEWKAIVNKKLRAAVKPLSKDDFYQILDQLGSLTTDQTLRQIIDESARAFNGEKYYKAYIAAGWVAHSIQFRERQKIAGISKLAKNPSERKAIEDLDLDGLIQDEHRISEFRNLVQLFSEKAETAGEKLDLANADFLKKLRADEFDWRPKPTEKYRSPYEDVK